MAWQREKQSVLHHGAAGAVLPQSLCQLPFLMTPECKKVILQGEAMLLQNHEVQNSLDRAMALMSRGTVRAPPRGMPLVLPTPSTCSVELQSPINQSTKRASGHLARHRACRPKAACTARAAPGRLALWHASVTTKRVRSRRLQPRHRMRSRATTSSLVTLRCYK